MLDLSAIFDVEDRIGTRQRGDIDVGDLPMDWRVWFEERAAIKEHHGGLPRERAEAEALAETVRLMQEEKNEENP